MDARVALICPPTYTENAKLMGRSEHTLNTGNDESLAIVMTLVAGIRAPRHCHDIIMICGNYLDFGQMNLIF
jgi:hypothetical protein